MNKSKKVLLISLLPVFFTMLFIAYVLVPAIQGMDDTYKQLKEEKTAYLDAQSQLNILKQNQSLTKKITELNTELSDFDYRFPPENDLAVFLVDMGKYAQSYNVRVISLTSESEKSLSIEDPKKDKVNKKKRSKRNNQEEILPIKLSEIPLDINVVGYYTDIVKFVNFLQNYQRQVSIEGIKISTSKNAGKEALSIKPELEMNIKSKVYTVVEQETSSDKSNEEKL